jgi:hypothetical protein
MRGPGGGESQEICEVENRKKEVGEELRWGSVLVKFDEASR